MMMFSPNDKTCETLDGLLPYYKFSHFLVDLVKESLKAIGVVLVFVVVF